MAHKWKNFEDFSAILLPSSTLITAAAHAKQFGVKLIKWLMLYAGPSCTTKQNSYSQDGLANSRN